MPTEIVFVNDIQAAVLQYLVAHLTEIVTFECVKGMDFQIRIGRKYYEALPQALKDELLAHEQPYNPLHFVKGLTERWLIDRYWESCDAYLFDFKTDRCFVVIRNIDDGSFYGDYSKRVVFFDATEFTPFIRANLTLRENQPPVIN